LQNFPDTTQNGLLSFKSGNIMFGSPVGLRIGRMVPVSEVI
jgi:hypothetical protein